MGLKTSGSLWRFVASAFGLVERIIVAVLLACSIDIITNNLAEITIIRTKIPCHAALPSFVSTLGSIQRCHWWCGLSSVR